MNDEIPDITPIPGHAAGGLVDLGDERVVTMGELLKFGAICDTIANCGFTVDEAVMAMSRLGMIDIFEMAQASGVFDDDGNEIEPFEEE